MPAISDALYYPYIRMKREDWLKATLLFFPHIVRLIPKNFVPRDTDFVKKLAQTPGLHGDPLVQSYEIGPSKQDGAAAGRLKRQSEDVAHDAGLRLVRRIVEDANREEFRTRFTQEATAREASERGWENGDSTFQIHRDKLGVEVWTQLQSLKLAWHPSDGPGRRGLGGAPPEHRRGHHGDRRRRGGTGAGP